MKHRPATSRSRARRGLTMLEMAFCITLLALGISGIARVTVSLNRAGAMAHDTELATQAARAMIERIQSESFSQAFRSFNALPSDDPGGPGSAPGANFAVPGLRALPGDADGLPGEVLFPTPPGQPGKLAEDLVDARLGLPRDLDGDGLIDSANHATDYRVLPLHVRVVWQARDGTTGTVELSTILANF